MLQNDPTYAYLNELNEVQRQAVEHTEGPSLIIAGAGSGKTRVLTYRIAHLLRTGKKPWSILALTFTNKAAKEMKNRIAQIVGTDLAFTLWTGTFHSVFAKILRIEAQALGYPSSFTIYDTSDAKSLVKKVLKDLKLSDKEYGPGEVMSIISQAKNNLVTPEMYVANPDFKERDIRMRKPMLGKVYQTYVQRCRQAKAMDFDDLLLNTNLLFLNNPEILRKYQEKFSYVLVDEYQDTNISQYLIIKKLSESHKNICVVGDDAQSIYAFRGAKIENILNFRNDYPEYTLYKLEQNYRSTQVIVEAANSVIAHNSRQIQKKVYSEKAEGQSIELIESITDKEEGFKVSHSISEKRLRQHYEYKDFAILYRTNAQSRVFEESLRKLNIPYKIYGGLSFYQRKEIKDLLSYYRLIINPDDNEAFKRIINYPKRGVGGTTLGRIEDVANSVRQSMWQVVVNLGQYNIQIQTGTRATIVAFVVQMQQFASLLKDTDAYELARKVAAETGILKELHNGKTPEELSRHENVQELLNSIKDFVNTQQARDEESTLATYMENVALLTNEDNEKDEDKNKVVLMTIHAAKGLEFKNVYITGLEEELFPSQMSTGSVEELEEERRLFYVAITRAEENLHISYARSRMRWGQWKECTASRFIREIDSRYIDQPSRPLFGAASRMTEAAESISKERSFSFGQKTQPKTQQPVRKPEIQEKLQGRIMRPVAKTTQQEADAMERKNAGGIYTILSPSKLNIGQQVEHQRFGMGTVTLLEGNPPDVKASIAFEKFGEKQLLLKFAKLRIV